MYLFCIRKQWGNIIMKAVLLLLGNKSSKQENNCHQTHHHNGSASFSLNPWHFLPAAGMSHSAPCLPRSSEVHPPSLTIPFSACSSSISCILQLPWRYFGGFLKSGRLQTWQRFGAVVQLNKQNCHNDIRLQTWQKIIIVYNNALKINNILPKYYSTYAL